MWVGEFHIDHRNSRCALVILFGEKTAALERNAQYLQVVRFNDVVQRPIHVVVAGGFWLTVNPELPLIIRTQWQSAPRERDRFDVRHHLKFFVDVAEGSPHRACVGDCGDAR